MSKRSAESGGSPPPKKPRMNIPNTLHVGAYRKTIFASIANTRDEEIGIQCTFLPAVIAELVQHCERLESVHVDRWFTQKSNCGSRFAKLADPSVLTLGGLFFCVLDSTQKCSKKPWADILNHGMYQRRYDSGLVDYSCVWQSFSIIYCMRS